MNDRQRARHNRNLAVRTVCNQDANRALWSSLPAFTLLFDRLQAKVSLVNACALIQGNDRTGVTGAKNDARAKMCASTLEIGGAVSTYGFLAGDADLQETRTPAAAPTLRHRLLRPLHRNRNSHCGNPVFSASVQRN